MSEIVTRDMLDKTVKMNLIKDISELGLGKVHIISIGQASFIVKTPRGQLIGIDIYLSDFSERDEGHVGFKRMLPKILGPKDLVFDYLVATHPHSDHFDYDSMSELMDNGHTKLFASLNCRQLSQKLGLPDNRITYIKPGDSISQDDFILNFVNCDHGEGAPDAVGVVITTGGKIIYETGDTCLRLDRADEINSIGHVDVLIGPINGAYGNMNEKDLALLSASLNPSLTIPCHYGMFASHYGLPGLFMNHMKEICPENNYLIMTQGEILTL